MIEECKSSNFIIKTIIMMMMIIILIIKLKLNK